MNEPATTWRLGLEQGLLKRWSAGLRHYRAQDAPYDFVGCPIAEAYDEMLDAINYVDEALRQDLISAPLNHSLRLRLACIATDLQTIALRIHGDKSPDTQP